MTAAQWIDKLQLQPHPEGGYYREIYRSEELIAADALPSRYTGSRPFVSLIHFLLKDEQVSKFHRLKSDEIWHFYTGTPVALQLLDNTSGHREVILGADTSEGHTFQTIIRRDTWFGAFMKNTDTSAFALLGCAVAPGFTFDDFELAEREHLLSRFPQYSHLIHRLT